ncbi:hypothetical protein ABT061_23400 [Streptosporangium sp. NPDC002544]|uniref:hypothetical protein n=1 Tax=Streptosporangium sp. NPDC002544 TaxID=3154538 RepID=UPI0033205495
MRFLERERATMAKLLPDLDEYLQEVSLMELEGPDSPGIQYFRDFNGVRLVVPRDYEGRGATALDALRVQRALGSRTPSLAVATTLHHVAMATLFGLATTDDGKSNRWELVNTVVRDNLLVAFGFAEERPGAGILSPSMTATDAHVWDWLLVNGRTRPCSLARSMDLFAASVMIDGWNGPAMILVPADAEGLSVGGAGAESEQVTLDGVTVSKQQAVPWAPDAQPDAQPDVMLTAGFAWFQLLMTGSYLGAASTLVERVLLDNRVPESERVQLLMEVEDAMSAAEGVARRIDDGDPAESTLADSLYIRYCVQDTLSRVVPRAVELLGHLDSTASDEVGYLATFANGLALQPPTRSQTTGPLAAYLDDGPLTIA